MFFFRILLVFGWLYSVIFVSVEFPNFGWLEKFSVGLAMKGSQNDERHELFVEIMKNRMEISTEEEEV